MGQWVITVVGITVLSVLCDVILPEGQTRKYIKTVVGIVVTLVMLQPIVGFIGGSYSLGNTQSSTNNEIYMQQTYLDMVEDKQNQAQIITVQNILEARGINVEDISLSKTNKVITVNLGTKHSQEYQAIIDSIFKTYFYDYKITIKWK